MRRKDREITDRTRINEIIADCYCCRLGFNDNGRIYIVPLNFGFEDTDGKRIFYFHGAAEGRKIDLIKNTHYAGFELDTNYKLKDAASACSYSAAFQSVIGEGRVDLIEDSDQKKHALRCIMYHNTGRADWDFSPAMLDKLSVFSLEAEELSCKEHS
ncbi:pyridoxamine 5'-phosphate oxidase family protein [Anaerolentibacter hominis]|uniref:pyridoxamine 5'-phosphate oxidase family protein n=1 Tax=Anaerolentibacter hominis TaxID=3079009 RepID=UPI0031B8A610